MKKPVVWFVNFYASKLNEGVPSRHYYFARELARRGYEVYLLASDSHHLLNADSRGINAGVESVDGFSFVKIPTLKYKNAHSILRFLSEYVFGLKLRFNFLSKQVSKPDVIMYSSPGLIPYPAVYRLAKKKGAKLIFDVRDIWPLTLVEIGGLSDRHVLVQYLQRIEDFAYATADVYTSNWPYADEHMKSRGARVENFFWIPNGFSTGDFEVDIPLGTDFQQKIPKGKFLVLYTGTFGKANALDALLEAAILLKNNKKIAILLVGGGKDVANVKEYIKRESLDNVVYLGAVPKTQIPNVLKIGDACYVGFLKSEIYRFGSSLTKLPEYMAAAKPIVYASSSRFQPITLSRSGITVDAESPEKIAQAILTLSQLDDNDLNVLGQNAKKYAIDNFEYEVLVDKLEDIISRLAAQ